MVNLLVDFVSLLSLLVWCVWLAAIFGFVVILADEVRRMLARALRTLWRAASRHGRSAYVGGAPGS